MAIGMGIDTGIGIDAPYGLAAAIGLPALCMCACVGVYEYHTTGCPSYTAHSKGAVHQHRQ
jgi:hypothetical protein